MSSPMIVHYGLGALSAEWNSSVVCIGTFDGVHLGHQALIRTAKQVSLAQSVPLIVMTFDRHPLEVLAQGKAPPLIATLDQNLAQFAGLGAAVALILPFDRPLSQMTAEDFLRNVLKERLHASHVVVGHDFAFGRGRVGTAAWLAGRMPTTVVEPVLFEGKRVSSREIRSLIAEGRVEQARQLLGRPFRIEGVVGQGARLGRELGFPTANLQRTIRGVTPIDGVYCGVGTTQSGSYLAAISIGVRPTLESREPTIEAHLIDYPGGSLYGTTLFLDITSRIRDQMEFSDLEALKEQIASDVQFIAQNVVTSPA